MRPAAAAVAKILQTCPSLKIFSLDVLILDLTVIRADFSCNAGIPGSASFWVIFLVSLFDCTPSPNVAHQATWIAALLAEIAILVTSASPVSAALFTLYLSL